MNTVWIDFDEVKQKVSMREVLEVFGIADQFQQRGATLVGCCPLPSHRHGPRPNREQFKVTHKEGIDQWFDFGDCRRGGTVVDFVQAMTGYSLAHTRLWFYEHFGGRLSTQRPRESAEPNSVVEPQKETARDETGWTSESPQAQRVSEVLQKPDPPVNLLKPLRFRLQLDQSVAYLRDRGLSEATVAHFGCGLCRRGVLAGYVCFPIYRWPKHDASENPLGYIGRLPAETFDDKHPRYKVPEGFYVSQCVHGLAEAMESSPDGTPLFVVEGAFKVAWLYEHGIPSGVSTLTANVSDEQARLLRQTGRPIVLVFDGHADAFAAMQQAVAKLYERTYVRIVRLPEGREPDDLSADELREFLPTH